MNELLQQILTTTYTIQSLRNRLRFLKDYFSAKFYNQQNTSFDQKDLAWLQGLDQNLLTFNADNLDQTLEQLQQMAEKLDNLTVYFTLDLPEDKLEQVVKYIRQNFKQNLLVDVKLDPSLIAGCAMVFKGVYKDYSLRKTIDDQKERIIEQFKLYLK